MNTNTEQEMSSRDGEKVYVRFGRFRISQTQIFYQSRFTFAMVNLRPIVEGHVLVVPFRVVPKLRDLTNEEYTDLWFCVRRTQEILEQHFFTTKNDDSRSFGFNVAIQDGVAAGQSVEHVHVHILPRKVGDLARNDDIYDELQGWAPTEEIVQWKQKHGLGQGSIHVPSDEQRRDRTMEEMEDEANVYRRYSFLDT